MSAVAEERCSAQCLTRQAEPRAQAKVSGKAGQHHLHITLSTSHPSAQNTSTHWARCGTKQKGLEQPKDGKGYRTQTKSPPSCAAHEVTSVIIEQPEQQARSGSLLWNTTACISLLKSFRLTCCFFKVSLEHPRMQKNDNYCGALFSSQCSVLICVSMSQLENKTPQLFLLAIEMLA